jgi:iron complex transport system substrate-binding protein
MKKTFINRIIIFMAVTTLILTLSSGCSKSETSNAVKNKTQNEIKDETKNETESITDMAGRTVEIPNKIEKVYCTNPIGTIFLYTLAPKKLVGWNYPLSQQEKKYINKAYYDLPVLGGWFGKKNTGNIEEILKVNPDIIIAMGSIDNTDIDSVNKIQEQTGIPVVMVYGEDLLSFDKSYEFVGSLLGKETKAKELAEYVKGTIDEVKSKVENIPEDKRIRVYYAEGPNGLQTDPETSPHTQVLKLVGGKNVADVSMQKGYGRTEVSLEQILLWNPDMIITDRISNSDELSFYQTVFKNEEWKEVEAVKNGKVYGIPQCPFSWFDRPPSVNRILGLKWLGSIIYPDTFDYDIKNEVKVFYDKFYHYNLTEDEINEILDIK